MSRHRAENEAERSGTTSILRYLGTYLHTYILAYLHTHLLAYLLAYLLTYLLAYLLYSPMYWRTDLLMNLTRSRPCQPLSLNSIRLVWRNSRATACSATFPLYACTTTIVGLCLAISELQWRSYHKATRNWRMPTLAMFGQV